MNTSTDKVIIATLAAIVALTSALPYRSYQTAPRSVPALPSAYDDYMAALSYLEAAKQQQMFNNMNKNPYSFPDRPQPVYPQGRIQQQPQPALSAVSN